MLYDDDDNVDVAASIGTYTTYRYVWSSRDLVLWNGEDIRLKADKKKIFSLLVQSVDLLLILPISGIISAGWMLFLYVYMVLYHPTISKILNTDKSSKICNRTVRFYSNTGLNKFWIYKTFIISWVPLHIIRFLTTWCFLLFSYCIIGGLLVYIFIKILFFLYATK